MMRGLILAVAVALALFVAPAAAQPYSRAEAEKYISDAEAAWVAAEVKGDPSVA